MLDLFRLLELFDVAYVETTDGRLGLLTGHLIVSFHPAVLQGLGCCHPTLWPSDQLLDQVLGFLSDILPFLTVEVKISSGNHLQDFLIVVTVEGRVTTEENVEHAASRPHVTRHVVVARQHLGRDVVGSARTSLHSLQSAAVHNLREAEVDDLEISFGIFAYKEEVLWLEISVDDVHGVAVVESLQDLLEDSSSHILAEELRLDDAVEEFTSRAQPKVEYILVSVSGDVDLKLTL